MSTLLNRNVTITTTIQLLSDVVSYIVRATGATKERKRLRNEIRECEFTLKCLMDEISDEDENFNWTEISNVLEGPASPLNWLRDVFTTVKVKLETEDRLDDPLERIKWNFSQEDVERFIYAVDRGKHLLQFALAHDFRNFSQEARNMTYNSANLTGQQQHKERLTVLNWLSTMNYANQQNDYIRRQKLGTNQYLLGAEEIKKFIFLEGQTVVCQGNPGTGKTIITAALIDNLLSRFRNVTKIGIAFLYCDSQLQHEQGVQYFLGNLLKQLAQGRSSTSSAVKVLYERHEKSRTRPSVKELSNALYYLIGTFSKVFILIDGLDEIAAANQEWLLFELLNLQDETLANIFVTSRSYEIPMLDRLKNCSLLIIHAKDHDINKYLDSRMLELPFNVRGLPEADIIKNVIVQASNSMFLLARLQFDFVAGTESLAKISTALDAVSTKYDTCNHAYQGAIDRIKDQPTDDQNLALRTISWLAFAKRPLTPTELQHAMIIRADSTPLDDTNVQTIERIISVCAGLVIIDRESNIIRLVHSTAREYLQQTYEDWSPDAEAEIAKTCVAYLSFGQFDDGICQNDDEFEQRLRLYALYDYAAHNWGYHAQKPSTEVQTLILDFFNSQAKVSAASQALFASANYSGYSQDVPDNVTGLHLAAYYGLSDVLKSLEAKDYLLDPRDSYGRTPILWAAMQGHEEAVSFLLAKDAGPNSEDSEHGRAPLLLGAAANGHTKVVEFLLAQSIDPNSKDNLGRTALSLAAENGHKEVVELLLTNTQVEKESKSIHGRTPLSWASGNGHESIVSLLLAQPQPMEPSSEDDSGRTALSWGSGNGYAGVAERLLARIDFESEFCKDNIDTPLAWAATNGHRNVVRLLLGSKYVDFTNPDSKNKNDRTPLSLAAENGHNAVVELILATGKVDPNSKDGAGRTPLSWAAAHGHKEVVETLLAVRDVDPEIKDFRGLAPISWAAKEGHEPVVVLLLSEGVDLDLKDSGGQTPLAWASENGHDTVVKLLLENGADIEAIDSRRSTPLLSACRSGHTDVVRLLLEEGANPDSRGINNVTPLYLASRLGHVDIVKTLLESGANIKVTSKNGWTPLHTASRMGHLEVVKMLVGKGADITAATNMGSTSLDLVANHGRKEILAFLQDAKENRQAVVA